MKQVSIFGVDLAAITKDEFKGIVRDGLAGSKKITIAKVYSEMLVRARHDQAFLNTLNSFDYRIVDGRGVVWAAHYLSLPSAKNNFLRRLQSAWQLLFSLLQVIFAPRKIESPIPENIAGTDAFLIMCQTAMEQGSRICFFGATDATLNSTMEKLRQQFPKLTIAGAINGYDYQNDPKVNPIKEITETKPEVLFVALGSPKQEQWIESNLTKLTDVKVVVGEGGTLDRIANPIKQAPGFINKIGLEWLWRLFLNKNLTENRTNLSRFWNSVPMLIIEAYKEKLLQR